jgi:hypothetical protein
VKNKKQDQRRREKLDRLIHEKGGKCANCGLLHNGLNSACFDFHHLQDKEFHINLSNMNRKMSILQEEADKTTLLCANCHRLQHDRLNNDKIGGVQ